MRTWARRLTGVGVALLVLAVALAGPLGDGSAGARALPVGLALAGLAVVVAALALVWTSERDPADLVLDDEQAARVARDGGLPPPTTWAPLAGAGLGVAATGALAGEVLLGLGLGVAAVAVGLGAGETWTRRQVRRARRAAPDAPPPLDRETVRTARRVRRFAEQHAQADADAGADLADDDDAASPSPGADGTGGAAPPAVDAVVEHLGRYGAKVVLVGADGRFGELVVEDTARARLACALAGATVHEGFDRELSARMRQTDEEWSRMGGGSARVPAPVADRTA